MRIRRRCAHRPDFGLGQSGQLRERVGKKTKSVKTSGGVCGSVFSAASSDSLPGAVLVLRNSAGVAVAKTQKRTRTAAFNFQR